MATDINKEILVDMVANKTGMAKKDVEVVVDNVVDVITDALHQDRKVTIASFGTFKVTHRAAREGINPQTKARITIPAVNTPKFTAGKRLKEMVRTLAASSATPSQSE
ncbi:MAG TPA: HU family DNA-binding protein [Candidatus Bathyarchaeia archaeon]|nr:HU family DNA-binding protein [Candidatus Bathyarchaeia archaeon]